MTELRGPTARAFLPHAPVFFSVRWWCRLRGIRSGSVWRGTSWTTPRFANVTGMGKQPVRVEESSALNRAKRMGALIKGVGAAWRWITTVGIPPVALRVYTQVTDTMGSWVWIASASWVAVGIVLFLAVRGQRKRVTVAEKRDLMLDLLSNMHWLTSRYQHDRYSPIPVLLNRARCVFFEDSRVMKWLNQMLDKPGHLTVHFPELMEAMSAVTGTPVPNDLESCFVSPERVEPHDTEEHGAASG